MGLLSSLSLVLMVEKRNRKKKQENCQKVHIPYLTYEHFIDCYSNSYYCKQVAITSTLGYRVLIFSFFPFLLCNTTERVEILLRFSYDYPSATFGTLPSGLALLAHHDFIVILLFKFVNC